MKVLYSILDKDYKTIAEYKLGSKKIKSKAQYEKMKDEYLSNLDILVRN
jgi:hypothetical protein